MPKMRAVQVSRPKGPLELVEREIPDPGPGRCGSRSRPAASATATASPRRASFPGIQYPRVPGHEVVGDHRCCRRRGSRLDDGPARRRRLARRQLRLLRCLPRAVMFFACQTATLITGVTSDGGYAEYMVAPAEALARVPDELSLGRGGAADVRRHHDLQRLAQQRRAARRYRRGARPRRARASRRAVRGEAGLQDRRDRARRGQGTARPASSARTHYIDSAAEDPAAALQKLGGAKAILATVTSGEAMNAVAGRARGQRHA